ncbi:MAG: methylmalonyl-CoA mutase family protein [bacterium]|nr:methylmalonyl-CoA mutase family protein [bacterium]
MSNTVQKTSSSHDRLTLEEFPSPTLAQWKELAITQLAGGSFEKRLVTKTVEGIDIQPLYTRDNSPDSEALSQFPGTYPYSRHTASSGYSRSPWQICETPHLPTAKQFNKAARNDLHRGLSAVKLVLDDAGKLGFVAVQDKGTGVDGTSISTVEDAEVAFSGLWNEKVHLHIEAGACGAAAAALFAAAAKNEFKNLSSFTINPYSTLASSGEIPWKLEEIYRSLVCFLKWADATKLSFPCIAIDSRYIAEAGGSMVDELAVSMSMALEIMRACEARGLPLAMVAEKLVFRFSVGTEFFKEISKFRAARSLWAKIARSCFPAPGAGLSAEKMTLHTSSLHRNKTALDPHVNMLRTTVEGFAAACAGADLLELTEYNDTFELPGDFSRRIARNIQIILSEESHVASVIDPAGGSYFVESFTRELEEAAYNYLQQIEKTGGFEVFLKSGQLSQQIKERRQFRRDKVETRKDVIVGSSLYVNLDEMPFNSQNSKIPAEEIETLKNNLQSFLDKRESASAHAALEKLESTADFSDAVEAAAAGATISEISTALMRGAEFTEKETTDAKNVSESCPAITPYRASADYEGLRSQAWSYEREHGEKLEAMLVTMGPLRQHKARSDFSESFLAPSGIRCRYVKGMDSSDEALAESLASGLRLFVLCSTDEDYPLWVTDYARRLKEKEPSATIVLAGYPEESIEAFRQAGVDEFIHLRANNFQTVSAILARLTVR